MLHLLENVLSTNTSTRLYQWKLGTKRGLWYLYRNVLSITICFKKKRPRVFFFRLILYSTWFCFRLVCEGILESCYFVLSFDQRSWNLVRDVVGYFLEASFIIPEVLYSLTQKDRTPPPSPGGTGTHPRESWYVASDCSFYLYWGSISFPSWKHRRMKKNTRIRLLLVFLTFGKNDQRPNAIHKDPLPPSLPHDTT